jgi:hypothetical protein
VADCGLARTLPDASVRVLPARIVHASIVLERGGRDNLGRPLAHTREEFVGGALHELGHALGFQGHARRGDTVMDRSVDEVRRAGRRLLEKGAFRDDTLRALYAVPSGTVVRRISLTPAQTRPVDRLFEIAERRGFVGPLLRVGDRDARIAWFAARGPPIALMVFDVDRALRNPATLAVVPTGPARRLLEEES